MLWSKRRSSSRQETYPISSKQPGQHNPIPSSVPSTSSFKLPISSGKPAGPHASQSSLPMGSGFSTPSTSSESLDYEHKLVSDSKQTRPNHRPTPQATAQTSSSKQPFPVPDINSSDLYTYNSLHSFSFGSAQSQQPPLRTVHPLSSGQGEGETISDDIRFGSSDVTPRPSVVAYEQPNSQQGNSTQASQKIPSPDPSGVYYALPAMETNASSHAGSLSPSVSVTSLSSTSNGYSRSNSRTSHLSSSTNQTSAEQSSITDTDSDADEEHRHSSLRTIDPTTRGPDSSGTGSNTAVEFSSDEDFGDSEYDYDGYDEEGMNIEIGSAQYEGSVATHDWDFYVGISNGSGSIRSGHPNTERRGSNPIAIPGAPPTDTSAVFVTGRSREDSLATLRRPSRSLDNDFLKMGLARSTISGQPSEIVQTSPVSVPGSGSDWKILEERSKTREPTTTIMGKQTFDLASHDKDNSITPDMTDAAAAPIFHEFDLDWAQMQRGITRLDSSAMGDIVGSSNLPRSPSDRRPSAVTIGGAKWLFSWSREARRPSAATVSSYGGDTFGKAIRDWDGPSYQAQRKDWSFKKEKADPSHSSIFSAGDTITSTNSTKSKAASGGIPSPRGSLTMDARIANDVESSEQDFEKDKGPASTMWKGMRSNSHEFWSNDRVGRFRVDRRSQKATAENKGPQQRLLIQPVKYLNSAGIHIDGPPVTIHKHSKAAAFSISRHYRRPRSRSDVHPTAARTVEEPGLNSAPTLPGSKRGSSMILLAPRRVQEAYTSTNTTRKLESHGLLDDTATGYPQDARDKDRHRRSREKQQPANKEKKGKERGRMDVQEKGKGKAAQQGKDDIHVPSAITALTQLPLPPPPASAPSMHTYPPGYPTSSSNTAFNPETGLMEPSISRNSSRHSRRRRRVRDTLEQYPDDEDGNENGTPSRTPHSEAFGTMDAALIEQLRQDHSHTSDSDKSSLWNRLVGRSSHSLSTTPAQLHTPFIAPWLALQSRVKQESHQVIINTLNDSFKDVGLLPSNYSTSRHSVPTSQRRKKIAASHNNNDPFKQIPDDSLYMLLPLWPGDTDPRSELSSTSFKRPIIHNRQRQYLLVYYKPPPEEENKKGDKEVKKQTRSSPTSSHDSTTKREDRVSVLLTSFHITARLVPYQNLQGTGVRVPDEGLTITGSLEAAYARMPPRINVDDNYYEYVLGICHSRDAGIEFYPDGLVKMGLCEQSDVPLPVSEEDTFPEPEVQLTPLGRAVLEMIWSGALALTSFGTN